MSKIFKWLTVNWRSPDPAHDLQAIDRWEALSQAKAIINSFPRAFRIGQTRDVSIYRLLSAGKWIWSIRNISLQYLEGSIEEHIYRRQIYKQQQMAIGYEASAQTR